MRLIQILFGTKCRGCGQKIKGEHVSSLLCQTCHTLEQERKQEEEEEERKRKEEEELERQRQEQQRRDEEQKHKLQEEQKRKEKEQKRKAKEEVRKRKQGKPSVEEIQRLRAEKEQSRRLAEEQYQKKKLAEYEMQRAQTAEERLRKLKAKKEAEQAINRGPNKLRILILKTGSKPLDEPRYIGQVMEAMGMPIYALPDGTHIENIRCVSNNYLNDATYITGLVIGSGYDPQKCTVTPFNDRDGGSGVVIKMR